MRSMKILAIALFAAIPAVAFAATVGGVQYATQYDYGEFRNATDGKKFRVVIAGNPFPDLAVDDVARRLLPAMQANKPRPRLTFTYDKPAEEQHPDYRLVLVFDAADDLGSGRVCNGVTRFKRGTPGRFNLFAVYCRNDLAMSETTAWTDASGPDDPRVGELFKDLFGVVFIDSLSPLPRDGKGRR